MPHLSWQKPLSLLENITCYCTYIYQNKPHDHVTCTNIVKGGEINVVVSVKNDSTFIHYLICFCIPVNSIKSQG